MKLSILTSYLETIAPLSYQEDYDNSGLIVGTGSEEIHGALVSLDCTEAIIDEAIQTGCNLVISHHPIVFKGIKKFNGRHYADRVIQKAIRNNIAIYAIHTNLDHVERGVNSMICSKLGISNPRILSPKRDILKKLVTFVPIAEAGKVRSALFSAGAGSIGNYTNASFNVNGSGTFLPGENTHPFAGERGVLHTKEETKIEVIYSNPDERKVLLALLESHPYEEVAYDIFPLDNPNQTVGAGMVGFLQEEMEPSAFLSYIKQKMECSVIRHTTLLPRKIKKVAVCGGAGSFLLPLAIAAGADFFITADFKYHEFFDADDKLVIADIGHFETEQFTPDLLIELINEKFSNFAVRKTEHNTNPINYFF